MVFKFKTLNEVKWFAQLYYFKQSKVDEENTLTQLWKGIWGSKRSMGQYSFLQKMIDYGILKNKGTVRKIGKYLPIYEIDKGKMEEILEETDVFKFCVEVFKKGKIVF